MIRVFKPRIKPGRNTDGRVGKSLATGLETRRNQVRAFQHIGLLIDLEHITI
jgi:hypothetical protein